MDEGLKRIIEKIEEDSKKEEERIIKEAEQEADKIIKQAEEEANKEVEKINKKYEEKISRTDNMVNASTRLSEKLRMLRAENKALELAFEEAKKQLLKSKKTAKYAAMIEKDILQSITDEIKGNIELISSKDDKKIFTSSFLKKLEKKLKRKVKLSKETRDILGGVIISVPEMKIEINKSFEAKIADCREKQISEIAATLFPKS